jgi:hypothetical protein
MVILDVTTVSGAQHNRTTAIGIQKCLGIAVCFDRLNRAAQTGTGIRAQAFPLVAIAAQRQIPNAAAVLGVGTAKYLEHVTIAATVKSVSGTSAITADVWRWTMGIRRKTRAKTIPYRGPNLARKVP